MVSNERVFYVVFFFSRKGREIDLFFLLAFADSFSDEEDEFEMAEEDGHNDRDDDIDQDEMRNLHIDGKSMFCFSTRSRTRTV